ncbi:aspartate/glutamate racemase family protein [Peristeroidobacter soli]|jgi:hypothetical protein|uniref:hypothetical protein n=1 Tax=Peristeroidobacter soli TaxID=2497877 RepID=UPI00101D1245|nr:hypothetical protein [Peristeroidobacter soli]
MTESMAQAALGIVEMANKPLRHPGHLGHPGTFAYPVVYAGAATAFADRILNRDPAVAADYVRQGERLQEQGIKALLTTCGFNVAYQSEIARRLQVPVATSSLLLLPLLLRLVSTERAVGVITFDRHKLDPALLEMSGVSASDVSRLKILGLDGTRTWHELSRPEPELPLQAIGDDLMLLIRRLVTDTPTLGGILLECSALCPFSPRIRAETGLPVLDFVSLANLLQASVADLKPFV